MAFTPDSSAMAFTADSSVPRRARGRAWLLVGVLAAVLLAGGATASASTPPGFRESTVFSGLNLPTNLRFSPDGRVFVAEKRGLIKVFDGARRHHADRLRRPAHQGVQLLGPRACSGSRSTRTSRPSRTCTCSTPTTRRSAAPRPPGEPPARPTTIAPHRRARPPTGASSAAGSRASRRGRQAPARSRC